MKKLFIITIVSLFALSASTLSAQSLKFGHINKQELFQLMPQRDTAQKKVDAYAKDLGEMLEELRVDYNKKLDAFQKGQATWSESIKSMKQKEIIELGTKLEERQKEAEQEFTKEQQKLMEPIITAMDAVIAKVAKANGFTYIFDISTGGIIYFNEAQSVDVMPLVKKELKITK